MCVPGAVCMHACMHAYIYGHSLSHVAFRGGVEGGQLHCAGILWSHLKQHFLKWVKCIIFVHIILVDLKEENALKTQEKPDSDAAMKKEMETEWKCLKLGWCALLHQPWGRDAPLLQIGLHLRYAVCSGPDLWHRTSVHVYMLCVRWHWGGSVHVLKILPARLTGGVSRVDNTENTRVAVLPGFCDSSLELCNIQTPAVVLIQVVIDLHGPQVSQGGWVQRVLGDGDQDSGSVTALASHQQLQNGLVQGDKWSDGYQAGNIMCYIICVFWDFCGGLLHKLSTENISGFLEVINQSYHNSITGPSGEVYVVRVGGYPTISPLYVAWHILTHALDALAGTVGPWNTCKWTLVWAAHALIRFPLCKWKQLEQINFASDKWRWWKVACLWLERLAGWEESGLTYTVASASLQNTPCSLFGVVWKLVIFQKFRVSTQS